MTLLSRRLIRVPSAAAPRGQAPIAEALKAVLDPLIVIKNTVHRYQETPVNLT
jgi:hypothetical protein